MNKKLKQIYEKSLGTKRKKMIAGCIAGAVVVTATGSYIMFNNHEHLELKKDEITVEYGKTISLNPKTYLVNDTDIDVIENAKVTSDSKAEKDKEYPAVGSYTVTITYEDEQEKVKVKVKDTTKPEVEIPETIEILQGTDLNTFDFKSLVTVTDLSQLNDPTFDCSKVDVNTPAEYEVAMEVSDIHKNKTKATLKVTVVPKPEIAEGEVVVQEIVTDENGNKKVVNSVKPSSSAGNNKVVSNSSNTTTKPSTGSSSSSGTTTKPSTGGSTSGTTSSGSGSGSGSTSSGGSSSGGSGSTSSGGSSSGGSGSTSSGGSSSGGGTTPSQTLVKGYYAKCKKCGYFVKSTSLQEVQSLLEKHIDDNIWTTGCANYTYGSYSWYE